MWILYAMMQNHGIMVYSTKFSSAIHRDVSEGLCHQRHMLTKLGYTDG